MEKQIIMLVQAAPKTQPGGVQGAFVTLHRKRESICLIGSLFGASYWMKIIVLTIKFILLGPSTFELAAVSDTNLITLHHQSRHDREIRPTDEIESSYDDELGHNAIGQCRTSMTF